jgi:hypothetical protein
MKIICLALLLLATTTAHAIPILNVSFTQNNWNFELNLSLTDGAHGEFYINGVHLVGGPAVRFTGDLDPMPIQFLLGVNTPTAIVNGETIYGQTFTIVQPAGAPPQQTTPGGTTMPDTGASVFLLAAAAGLLSLLHWRARLTDSRA